MRIPLPLLAAAAALALAGADAGARTLYKLIDKNGKVTYVDTPPKDYDGQVIRVEIDPKANTATMPKYTPAPKEEAEARKPGTAAPGETRVAEARAKREAAQKAFANARDNPGPDDIQRIGNVGGGARPVPTEEYQKRLDRLEKAVKDAEEELKRAEQGR